MPLTNGNRTAEDFLIYALFYCTFSFNILIKLILFVLHFVNLTIGADVINSSEQTLKKPAKDSTPSKFTAPAISSKLIIQNS